MGERRLSEGGRIDRTTPVHFSFNGRRLRGFRGDTLASALLAEQVDVVGRSFKYSRRRGIVGCGAEEPNAIVQLGRGESSIPNLRATQVELYEGLEARSVSGRPGPEFAAGAVGRLLPPGFYYKTFMRPRRLWRFAEHFIRRAAGLGRAPCGADPDRYDKLNHHCDVLVAGAGPAGLQAALAAAAAGARVIVADEQNEFGGSLLASRAQIGGLPAAEWVARTVAQLAACERVQALPRSTVFGYYDHNFLGILERRTDHVALCGNGQVRQRLHRVRARQVILATGAIERPLVFSGNDLPGIMLPSAVSTYLQRYAVAAGERLVLFTAHDRAYRTAIDWLGAGRELVAIVDSRPRPDGELAATARDLGARIIDGHGVIEARGRKRVRAVLIAPLNRAGDALTGPARTLRCDLLASSGGYSPAIHLSSHTGARPRWSHEAAAFVPGKSLLGERSAGAAAGRFGLAECLRDGAAAGLAAAAAAGIDTGGAKHGAAPDVAGEPAVEAAGERAGQPPPLFLVPHLKPCSRAPAQFVDLQLDVTAADIELAAREGYTSVEHAKRYTALGFGTDQGKLGNVNGAAILSRARGQTIAETGTTMFRPPYTPVTFGALAGGDAGELFDPERHTAMHRWHEEHDAVWENVGRWKRPRYYPRPGESMREAVDRECLAVRRRAGMLDGSTLGKIDIRGPDTAEFLSRMYTGNFRSLAPGRCRYGLMLGEDGMIFDDGVTACLAENHYLMFTTTGGAAAVLNHLELWLQTEWPELRVYCTSVTDHWAVIAVAGPQARNVLRKVGAGVDLGGDAFPFMAWRDGVVAGVDARIFRISFSGELSYEIDVPAHYGRHVWERLMEAGAEFDMAPYGTEAMHVLRAEKGFIIVGQDTDGSVTPRDAGMAWALDDNPPFSYLGRRSLQRSDCVRPNRKQLVGLRSVDEFTVLPEGAQIVNRPGRPPLPMQGHVTSSYWSAHLGRPIALALVKGGRGRLGEVVHCPLADGRCVAARIVDAVFYDAGGERQRV